MTDAVMPRRRNTPLWLGSALVAGILFLAWIGPGLAPHDPIKPTYIIQDPATGAFIKPPFSAFTIAGFPLGTDALGRDTLSQVLWAIRPTLILVVVVGAVRLVLGICMGLLAGWSTRWPGRVAEVLTATALAAPVLFVALCAIAALGTSLGIWAFILGLSINGWAEPARLIAGQVRLIRGQPYIESARAMGASGANMVGNHVLPAIMPLAWVLLAIEISSTVMATAGLGFLGYFIYSIWVPAGDWSAVRSSGRPELGQMLASGAGIVLRQPWVVIVAGFAVALIVLSFNLLSEGMRREVNLGRGRAPRSRVGRTLSRAGARIGEESLTRLTAVRRRVPAWAGISGMVVLLLGGAAVLWRTANTPLPATGVAVHGNHLWATQGRDSQRTFWSAWPGPASNDVLWTLALGENLAGGPVVSAQGVLYVSTQPGALVALTADGGELWRTSLGRPLAFAPALNAQGDIFVLSVRGDLFAVSPAGALRWTATPNSGSAPLSAPVTGANGDIYYALEKGLLAVESTGQIRWEARLPTYSYITANLRLSPDERWLVFEDTLVDARTGATGYPPTGDMMDAYLVGTDGGLYQGLQGEMRYVDMSEDALRISSYAQWDLVSSGLGFRVPAYAGIAPDARIWVLYGSAYEYGRLVWLDRSGQVLSMNDLPDRLDTAALVGFDSDGTAYICGAQKRRTQDAAVQCRALTVGRAQPAWTIEVASRGIPVGGALTAGRLYVATSDGVVVAVGR